MSKNIVIVNGSPKATAPATNADPTAAPPHEGKKRANSSHRPSHAAIDGGKPCSQSNFSVLFLNFAEESLPKMSARHETMGVSLH